nr:hypothetical protein [Psychrobacter sp. PraFG1]UNK06349.1 hypothetical protein MN210_07390 [Psychrobacter sp. PraFG1]
MQDAGVKVSVALPINNLLKVLLFSRIDLRNHRKITVIDGKIGYVGSRNSADPEFRIKPKYAPWVDIMLRVQGPLVAQNQMLFANDWLMENPDTDFNSFLMSPSRILRALPLKSSPMVLLSVKAPRRSF